MSKESYVPRTGLYENEHYQLQPASKDRWQVRFLKGDFPETVVQYGAIKILNEDELKAGKNMTFEFEVISSPDENLSEDNVDLQQQAADVLLAIIESAIMNNEGYSMTPLDKEPS